jgi:hypothetical protein
MNILCLKMYAFEYEVAETILISGIYLFPLYCVWNFNMW